jgi:DNA topoisomerase I
VPTPEIVEAAEEAGLVYVDDDMPGITRRRAGKGFAYAHPDGRPVKDEKTLKRIRSLVIPPAYRDIWICPLENGHLQATGIDDRGRKQYRYHPRFREVREADKYERLIDFGNALPKIRERVDHDLALPGLPREKVLAAIVYLLEKSLIRVGNEEYAKENGSFGLTTMRMRHVKVQGANIHFHFLGKSKIKHDIEIHDRRLARAVAKIQELPGQHLFQYLNEDGEVHAVTSADVNAYLKEISGHDFTAKDFRTWAGTVLALTELGSMDPPKTAKELKSSAASVIKVVAKQLGNTPAVCRKCYVHPGVMRSFLDGSLREFIGHHPRVSSEGIANLVECAEDVVLDLLKDHEKEARKKAFAYAG